MSALKPFPNVYSFYWLWQQKFLHDQIIPICCWLKTSLLYFQELLTHAWVLEIGLVTQNNKSQTSIFWNICHSGCPFPVPHCYCYLLNLKWLPRIPLSCELHHLQVLSAGKVTHSGGSSDYCTCWWTCHSPKGKKEHYLELLSAETVAKTIISFCI